MALRGHVFTKQLFSSDCFALFIDTFLGKESGIINGCSMENTAEGITLNRGYFLVKGRFLEEEENTIFPIEKTTEGEVFCKLICEIDLSKENTTSVLNQAYYKIIEDANDYPTLRQDDITEDMTGIYQFEFARFKRTVDGISDFRDTRKYVDFNSIYSEVRTRMNYVLEDSESNFNTWFNSFKSTSDTSFDTWFSNIKESFDAWFTNFKNTSDSDLNEWMTNSRNSFDVWFQTIQDILDEDTAGHLLNLINANTCNIEDLQNDVKTNTDDIENLNSDKSDKKKVYNITLDTEWTGEDAPYTQTVEVEGILATDIVNIEPIYSDTLETRLAEKEQYAKISMINSANGSVTITCDEEKPTVALNVRLEVVY